MFNAQGLTPDLIINPIAFTSRMTYGQFLETLLGIVCCMTGRIGDATPFSQGYRDALYATLDERLRHFKPRVGRRQVVDEIADALRHLGFHPYGNQVMRNGVTGKLLAHQIFMGPAYVQKLKHMVGAKIRARGGKGQVHPITYQPVEGRVREGGLKLGEMERDCLTAHGAAHTLRDRYIVSSDPGFVHICRECNDLTIDRDGAGLVYCKACNQRDNSLIVSVPRGFKAFMQELEAINLKVKLHAVDAEPLLPDINPNRVRTHTI